MPNHSLEKQPFIQLLQSSDELLINELRPGEYHVTLKKNEKPAPAKTEEGKELVSREFLHRNAELLVQSGDFHLARNIFSFLLQKNLKDEKALKGFGECFFRLGDLPAAKKCFQAAWEIFAKPQYLVWLGQIAMGERDFPSALQLFERVKEANLLPKKERFDLLKEKGNCYSRLERYSEADECYRQAQELEPQNPNPYINLGMLEIQRKRLDLAEAYFQSALRLEAKNPKAHCGLGLIAADRADWALAEKFFMQTLELDSRNLIAVFQLLEMIEHLSQAEPVIEKVRAFIRADAKNTEVRFALAAFLFREGAWKECEREIDEILKIDSAHKNARKLKEEIVSHKFRN